jgi:uncharacterized protein
MSQPLPELLDPRRAVATEAEFDGELPLRSLPRLRELLVDNHGVASYRLRFGRDRRGHDVIEGHVDATLMLRCQRCNDRLALDVASDIHLALTEGLDEASSLPEEYEPLLLEGRLIRASELIEDELVLAVPAIPRHAEGQCRMPLAEPNGPADQGDAANDAERSNPFAGLAVLKPDRPE